MRSEIILQLDMPATPAFRDIWRQCVMAILQRIPGVISTNALATSVEALLDETYSQAPHRIQAALIDAYDTSFLQLKTDAGWQRSLELPPLINLPAGGQAVEAASLGLGLSLAKKFADKITYRAQPRNSYWRLEKSLPGIALDEASAIQLKFPASHRYLNVIGVCLQSLLEQTSNSEDAYKFQLGVQEIGANIVQHAYAGGNGQIETRLWQQGEQFVVEFTDHGQHTFEMESERAPAAAAVPNRGLLTGTAALFASMTIVNAGNYLFNLILGRWLGPAAFAELSLIVTLMLMVTLATTTLQTLAAKYAAIYTAENDGARLAGLRAWMGRCSWASGVGLLLVLGLGASVLQRFFHTESVWPFVLLGIGMPLFFAKGVDRGVLLGQTRFGALVLSYQVEMWVRLIAAIAFVALGWAVNGAVAALALSFAATWLVTRRAGRSLPRAGTFSVADRREVLVFAGPVAAALVGQILINNSDILIIKHFFAAEAAGQYAALALIGRIVFFATWAVVTTLFPIVAQREQKGEPHRHLLGLSLGLVLLVSAGIIAVTFFVPELIVNTLFGPAFINIAPLLWLYAVATALYALANVVITYRLSIGDGGGSILAVIAGTAQIAGIWFFHADLRQVVMVQILIMSVLLGLLLAWDTGLFLSKRYAK